MEKKDDMDLLVLVIKNPSEELKKFIDKENCDDTKYVLSAYNDKKLKTISNIEIIDYIKL